MASDSPDLRAYQQEWDGLADAVSGVVRPVADPTSAGANARHNLAAAAARLLQGKVVDGVAYVGCYKVAFERNCPAIPCVLGSQASFLPVGARAVNSLVPGTVVWAIVHPGLWYGVIVAVEPNWGIDPSLGLSDAIHQASRCGLRVDAAHHAILRLAGSGGVADWSAGRPFDGTLGGEWGAITETGLRVILDSAMVQLGAGEMAAVTAFYDDDLLRVSGYNYQHATCGTEEEALCDGAEVAIYRGETPYPHEQCGALAPGADPYRTLAPQAAQVDEPHYTAVEPRHDDQMAFHRVVELGGYLGQGGRRMVLAPPPGGGLYRYGGGPAPAGLLESFSTLAGRHVVRSAAGIWLVKQPAIPAPRRRARPESPTGDTAANYRFAGLAGGGAAHKVTGNLAAAAELPQLQRASGALDTIAYLCNWEGVHPLHYHARDWALPEEAATAAGTNQAAVDYKALAARQYLPPPEAAEVEVDHRYGKVKYFKNTSCIGLLEDGGVVIRGGNGESITLAGGSITLAAPGDVWLKAGRNVNTWAGYDVILRAKHGADLSATEAGVRIKAETDVQVLAGNGGTKGAVLIESRAESRYDYAGKAGEDVAAGGIQLKCARGDVVAWGRNLYLRTGGGDVDGDGGITLDAARGAGPIVAHARSFDRYLGDAATDYFGSDGEVTAANAYHAGRTQLGGGLEVGGPAQVARGGLVVAGDVQISGGHVYSRRAAEFSGEVGSIEGREASALEDDVQQVADDLDALAAAGKDAFAAALGTPWYAKDRGGADATIEAAGFSFRTVKQYRTADFRLAEDPWQQDARLRGAPAVWTEAAVKAGSTETYPYPGKEKWADEATLLEQDHTLYDPAGGVARPRDDAAYGDPKYATPAPRKPDGRYAVIV